MFVKSDTQVIQLKPFIGVRLHITNLAPTTKGKCAATVCIPMQRPNCEDVNTLINCVCDKDYMEKEGNKNKR